MGSRTDGDHHIAGALSFDSLDAGSGTISRTALIQNADSVFPIANTQWRVWDNLAALLPATSATDDLGLYPGTWGTTPWLIRSADVKTTTVTLRAATEIAIPAEYDAGESLTLRVRAGMITTIADTSATVDAEIFCKGGTGALLSADLCATSAININSTTFANRDFTITPTSRVAGDVLQIRITIAVVDGSTVTAVIAAIEQVKLLVDIKG